ncbi:MAG TPA: branched-chain amino acid ABC transporter permease [Firmicutes bacterium]|nr:MAG: ABC transporter permease [Peptococcaceae bacterium 1109]HHT74199.1 branched-chain amino acid ABC transporter permease [Bacillota bacterium]
MALQQLINGLALGSVYALIALGYTMVYGIIKLINFAHGDIYMLGAYFGFYAITVLKLSLVPAVLTSMAGAALVGVLLERIAYRPLRNSPRIAVLITAIGASLLLQSTAQLVFGASFKPFPQAIPFRRIQLGPVFITNRQLLIFGVAVLLMVILHIIVHYTKLGKAMRAVSMDKEAALLMGINVDRIISATFAMGSALAAAAGILVGMYYNRIDPYMGMMPGLKAFVAAVLGGIGIVPGAVVGGLLMGVAENVVVTIGSSTLRDAVAFAILIVVLLFRPNGLLGKKGIEKV